MQRTLFVLGSLESSYWTFGLPIRVVERFSLRVTAEVLGILIGNQRFWRGGSVSAKFSRRRARQTRTLSSDWKLLDIASTVSAARRCTADVDRCLIYNTRLWRLQAFLHSCKQHWNDAFHSAPITAGVPVLRYSWFAYRSMGRSSIFFMQV